MSAPLIWILIPLGMVPLLWIPRRERVTASLGGGLTLLLAVTAWELPLETVLRLGPWAIKIASTLEILGRRLILTNTDRPLLALIYGMAAFWFMASAAAGNSRRLVPLGLAIVALLVASLAVEPFLYAALLIEIAALLVIPLLSFPEQPPGRGLIRFLIYQTLAMPFILFSGWLLAGIEASPGDLALVIQTAILLGLGFAFLLAIFPLHTWIPLLAEEAPIYSVGFILMMLPTATLLFALGFLERYTWLRTSTDLLLILRYAGILMLAVAGFLSAFQRHLGRIFGYAVILETGFSLLALSLGGRIGLELLFLPLIPHAVGMGVWALALSILQRETPSLRFRDVKGLARPWSFAATSIILAGLSLVGIPLLAGFPIRQALWEQLARQSLSTAFWVLFGSLGLLTGTIRSLAVLVMAPEGSRWESRETWPQRLFLGFGWLMLFILGLFPQWGTPILEALPKVFEHLGR